MKIWIDDIRPAPEGFTWCKTTNEALRTIRHNLASIEHIALDHDAGYFVEGGGDYINVLIELERLSRRSAEYAKIFKSCTFSIHSMNVVGVENMRRIIQNNGWNEIRLAKL